MNQKLISSLVACVGERFVLTEPAELLAYSFDAALDRAIPSAVVLPGSASEVIRVVKTLISNRQPYVARGAATSLCGGPIPLHQAVVVALTRLNKIGSIDKTKREVQVEPGVVNLRLQEEVEKEDLFYAPDPGSQKACTIGGNVAANAGGPHCLKYGVTSNHVLSLDMVLPDGNVMKFSQDDPGYDLTGFFVGSEGTLGVVTSIRLRLLPRPKYVRTMVVSFNTIEDAIQTVTDIIAAGILPATLEAMDKIIVHAVEDFIHAGYPLTAEAVLLIEVDGSESAVLEEQCKNIRVICERNCSFDFRVAVKEEERKKLWEGRRGAYAAMARLAPNVLVEDGAVPRTKLPEALRKIKEIAETYGLEVALLFHAGDGNLHPQIIFDERDPVKTKAVRAAGHKMLKACVDLGGTISGEHGIGMDKREAMKWLFTRETLSLFRRLKNAFDPMNLCNPDKLLPLVGKKEFPPLPADESRESGDPLGAFGFKKPASESELVDLVKSLARDHRSFGVLGSGSKCNIKEDVVIQTEHLNKILDFDKGNLTLTVQAGALLPQVRAEVENAGQYLWMAGEGTIGGVIATKSSVAPPLRDLILGMKVLLPTGEIVVFGAKTMKNVAGYDVPKLLIGSWGTLGVILSVTFRLYPYPPKELLSKQVKPFVLKDIHKKIKRAFDPHDILARRFNVSPGQEGQPSVEPIAPPEPNPNASYGDQFWRT